MMRRSYFPPKDRDVAWVWKPYFMERATAGTTHGSPYATDTHVPQLWFGAGVPAGVRPERVSVEDIAPTLAQLIGVPRPPQAMGRHLF
jgi:arylsulfatase A-like enzyme